MKEDKTRSAFPKTPKELELKKMELHEKVDVCDKVFCTEVMRVYNGWIYTQFHLGNKVLSSVFVPEYSDVNADVRTGR